MSEPSSSRTKQSTRRVLKTAGASLTAQNNDRFLLQHRNRPRFCREGFVTSAERSSAALLRRGMDWISARLHIATRNIAAIFPGGLLVSSDTDRRQGDCRARRESIAGLKRLSPAEPSVDADAPERSLNGTSVPRS